MYWTFKYLFPIISSLSNQQLNTSNRTLGICIYAHHLHHRPLITIISMFLFHLWRDWSDQRNSFRHLTQNSLAMCCIRLHLFLLYSSAFTKWPCGDKTTLNFMVTMLLGHIVCSLCTSPNVSTVKGLEFTIASVSARSVVSHSSFRDLPCVCNKDISIVRAYRICLSQTPPIWLHAGGFLC